MELSDPRRQNLRPAPPWQPGQSGNPNGRPVGSRTVFSQAFLKDLASVWSEEGRKTMVKTARNNPAVFFATCARLIPNDVRVTVEQSLPGNLSAQDWAVMREIVEAVKTAVPDASSKPPGQVLEYVLTAVSGVALSLHRQQATDLRGSERESE